MRNSEIVRSKLLIPAIISGIFIAAPSRVEAYHPFESKKLDVAIEASAGETFDDNVTFTKTDKKWDMVSELAVGLKANYEGRKHLLDLKGGTVQQIFARESDFNNNAQNADLKYQYLMTDRDTFRFKNNFRHYEEARSFDDQFGSTNGRYSRIRNRADLEYMRLFSSQWSGTLKYGNEFNLLSRADLRDSMINKGGFNIDYARSSATVYSLIYELLHHAFEETTTTSSASATVNSLAGGIKHYLKKRLFVEGKGGLDLISDFASDFIVKPLFSVSLNLDLDEKTQIQFFKYETRSTTSSYQSSVFTNHQISIGGFRRISERLSVYGTGFYGHGTFNTTDVKDNFFGANANLSYDLTEDLKATLSYNFNLVDSTDSGREYARNMTMIKLAYVFG